MVAGSPATTLALACGNCGRASASPLGTPPGLLCAQAKATQRQSSDGRPIPHGYHAHQGLPKFRRLLAALHRSGREKEPTTSSRRCDARNPRLYWNAIFQSRDAWAILGFVIVFRRCFDSNHFAWLRRPYTFRLQGVRRSLRRPRRVQTRNRRALPTPRQEPALPIRPIHRTAENQERAPREALLP